MFGPERKKGISGRNNCTIKWSVILLPEHVACLNWVRNVFKPRPNFLTRREELEVPRHKHDDDVEMYLRK
jgi:hypothetical protein